VVAAIDSVYSLIRTVGRKVGDDITRTAWTKQMLIDALKDSLAE